MSTVGRAPSSAGSRRRPASKPPAAAQAATPVAEFLAIPGYDTLAASQVVQRLSSLRPDELEAIRRYELATIRYRAGEDSYLNVISAQQDLFNAQQSQIVAQYNRLTSQLSLYKALGGGWK